MVPPALGFVHLATRKFSYQFQASKSCAADCMKSHGANNRICFLPSLPAMPPVHPEHARRCSSGIVPEARFAAFEANSMLSSMHQSSARLHPSAAHALLAACLHSEDIDCARNGRTAYSCFEPAMTHCKTPYPVRISVRFFLLCLKNQQQRSTPQY